GQIAKPHRAIQDVSVPPLSFSSFLIILHPSTFNLYSTSHRSSFVMRLALVGFLSAVIVSFAADAPITHHELVSRTQELYDAIVPGNQIPWKNISLMTASSPTRKDVFSTSQNLSPTSLRCRRV